MTAKFVTTTSGTIINNPPIARFLFDDTRFAPVWAVVRILLGLTWIDASWHKLSSPAWMQTGEALKGFWTRQIAVPAAGAGSPPIAYDWYRSFIQSLLDAGSYTWFAKFVAIGEFTVGVALVIGAFVGIAAVAAGFMNWNFMMAGVASTSPLLIVVAIALVLAWKTAGYYGVDRFLLPRLGTPWGRGKVSEPLDINQKAPNAA